MDFIRVALYGALVGIGYLLWSGWQVQHPAPNLPSSVVVSQGQSDVPSVPTHLNAKQAGSEALAPSTTSDALISDRYINVKTDVLDLKIDRVGGNIVYGALLQYPETPHSADSVVLFNQDDASLYLAQSGLTGDNGPDTQQSQALYTVSNTSYALGENQNALAVTLTWKNDKGLVIRKVFTFQRGQYAVDVGYQIENKSNTPWTGHFYTQLKRRQPQVQTHMFDFHTFTGAAYSTPETPYKKISFSNLMDEPLNADVSNGWVAMMQHYFLSAWIPEPGSINHFYSSGRDGVYTIGMIDSAIEVKPNTNAEVYGKLYAGPEIASILKNVAPHLDLTIDYGWLWFFSEIIFWLLSKINLFLGNWGWSIVAVTVLIKACFYHLSAKSYRSMANLRKLQPKIEAVRSRHGDDKQKLSQAMMELYRKEKVNPLGGCLPILIQIPVFFALYMVLMESVQLRQAPWILWIHDLSTKDPFYVLPIIMGITMFIQQKLSPPPPDPTQAKMMMFMPVFMTVLFLNFPSGLVLYWAVNNGLSVLQQWYITRQFEKAPAPKKKSSKK